MRLASNRLLAWALVVAWGALVWSLGSASFSADETSRFLGPLLHWLLPSLSPDEHAQALAALRKLAHPSVYGVFALFSVHALRSSFPGTLDGAIAAALGMSAALASADEVRQALTDARTGAVGDVLLDLLGAAAALSIFWIAARRHIVAPAETQRNLG